MLLAVKRTPSQFSAENVQGKTMSSNSLVSQPEIHIAPQHFENQCFLLSVNVFLIFFRVWLVGFCLGLGWVWFEEERYITRFKLRLIRYMSFLLQQRLSRFCYVKVFLLGVLTVFPRFSAVQDQDLSV